MLKNIVKNCFLGSKCGSANCLRKNIALCRFFVFIFCFCEAPGFFIYYFGNCQQISFASWELNDKSEVFVQTIYFLLFLIYLPWKSLCTQHGAITWLFFSPFFCYFHDFCMEEECSKETLYKVHHGFVSLVVFFPLLQKKTKQNKRFYWMQNYTSLFISPA